MKSSLVIRRPSNTSFHRGTIRSVHSCGEMPSSAAARATFWLCSSVPVRKNTFSPARRWYRAITSQATIS